MYKIWDKIKVTSKNEDKDGVDFVMYTVLQWISHDVDGKTKYLVWLTNISEKLLSKPTAEEIIKYYS